MTTITTITGDEGSLVMPFYLICDISWSMRGEMATLCDGIRRIQEGIEEEPILDDVARVGIITFAASAEVPLPLGRLADRPLPDIRCAGPVLTSYGAAFRKLAEELAEDYSMFRLTGVEVYRPCAYFLTDGDPQDLDWEDTFQETLTPTALARRGIPGAPIFVPFGFRDASVDTLRRLAYPRGRSKWYHARNANIESALTGLMDIIMKSLLKSTNTGSGGEPDHVLPDSDGPDFSSGPADSSAA